jgi:flagellar biosynthetic protein FlhB
VAADDQERTEAATHKRRREAREEGQVARSPEVLTAFVLAAGVLGLWVGARYIYAELTSLSVDVLRLLAEPGLTPTATVALAVRVVGTLVRSLSPMLFAAIVGGIAGNVVQVGFLVSFKAVSPNPERLDPVSGFKNLFQKSKIVDLLKNLLKVAVVGWAAYLAVRGRLPELPYLTDLPPRALIVYLLELGFVILRYVLLVYVLIALLDYAFQRWQYEERIKMSKQEVKDEYKETEGDPLIKSRIRSLQREMARRRMMAEVPSSDVVITNPTHFAVALRYDPERHDAPVVVAKGTERIAARIVELAKEHRIPLYQAPPIARTLYREAELGDPIPADLFQAVAEILAHVFRLAGKVPGG